MNKLSLLLLLKPYQLYQVASLKSLAAIRKWRF